METRIGLGEQDLNENTEHLLKFACSYFVLQIKALGFHWNVEGPHFIELHAFFEETYKELQASLDEIAERMRALGAWAPIGVAGLSKDTFIQDTPGILTPAKMLEALQVDYEQLIQQLRQTLIDLKESPDEGSKDLLVEHLRDFEKRLWMIRSLVQKV